MNRTANNVFEHIGRSVRPVQYMNLVDYANKYRFIDAAADSGKYSTSRTPYIEEPMQKMSFRSRCTEIVLLFGHQTGKTECLMSHIDYVTRFGAGHGMLILPTDKIAKNLSVSRLSPILNRMSDLDDSSYKKHKRDTMLAKKYAGGYLIITGSESAVNVKSMPIRFLWIDELSECAQYISQSGDFEMLAEARTATYSLRKKIFKSSTPKIEGECRIERNYNESTMKRYYIPCPLCGKKQVLEFENIIWDSTGGEHKPKTAKMRCIGCNELIPEYEKKKMLKGGEWIADKPGRAKEGYQLSTLYSPYGWTSWAEVVDKFLKSKHEEELLRAWTNSYMAKTFPKTMGEIMDVNKLFAMNREKYEHPVPEGVYILTAGVDIQGDRAEIEVVGWGLHEESWSIDYIVMRGDPLTIEFWDNLDLQLQKTYKDWRGVERRIEAVCVDSGYATTMVYQFTKPREKRNIFAVKGAAVHKHFISNPWRNNKLRALLFSLGTKQAKDVIFGRLKLQKKETDNSGYCHFPDWYQEAYFEGLTAEKKVKKYVKGFVQEDYIKIKPFNEPLDCRIYAYAAYIILNPNMNLIKKRIDEYVKPETPTVVENKEHFAQQKKWVTPRRSAWRNI